MWDADVEHLWKHTFGTAVVKNANTVTENILCAPDLQQDQTAPQRKSSFPFSWKISEPYQYWGGPLMMYITFQQLYKGKGEDSSQRLQSSRGSRAFCGERGTPEDTECLLDPLLLTSYYGDFLSFQISQQSLSQILRPSLSQSRSKDNSYFKIRKGEKEQEERTTEKRREPEGGILLSLYIGE